MAGLEAASGGETLVLDDGDYGTVELADKTYADHVTIMAENHRQAVLAKIELSNVHYLRVCGVTTTSGREGVLIGDASSYVEILESEFYGGSAMFDRDNPDYTQVSQLYGLQANGGSSHLLIENNYAHDVQSSGFVFFGVSDIVVRGNEADWLQSDGFKFAGVTNALVENNTGMQQVHSSPEAHVDFMQAQGDMSDSVFRGNVALMNTRSFQGLFFGNGTFANILLEQNVIYTGHTRGISVDCATCEATHNTILAAEENGVFLIHKQVTIHGVGTTTNNVTSTYLSVSGTSGSDHRLQYEDPASDFYYDDYYENATAGPGLTIQDLRPVAGSPADGQVGAYDRINDLLGP
jgi:small basic protein